MNIKSLIIVFSVAFISKNIHCQFISNVTTPDLSKSVVHDENDKSFKYSKIISVTDLQKYLTQLASDEFEGRETGQPGNVKAAKYIAEQFQKLGLKPLGDKDSYLQAIKFNSREITNESVLELGQTQLKHIENFGVLFPQPDSPTKPKISP